MIFREVEDRDLIAKARQGDVEAYNLLVSRWEKRVFNYLLRLVSNREDALDLELGEAVVVLGLRRMPLVHGQVLGLAVDGRARDENEAFLSTPPRRLKQVEGPGDVHGDGRSERTRCGHADGYSDLL